MHQLHARIVHCRRLIGYFVWSPCAARHAPIRLRLIVH
jgi:hypothetical protein